MGNETYLNTAAKYIETQQLTSKCQHILRYLDSDGWCKKCTMKSVSSGHLGIDKFIKRTQSKANNWSDPYLEWIPYDQFQDVKEVGEGNFSVVYSATWIQGSRLDGFTMSRKSRMQCPRSDAITVALKRIKDSQEMTDGYIKRLKSYYRCSLSSKKREQSSLKFYGLTRDPSNGEYMLVIQYTAHGNLRTLLNTNFSSFQWSEKIWWLCDIASSLLTIHKSGHVHGNIHPGNILQLGINQRETSSTLTDAGLSLPANHYSTKINHKRDVYGVLPYMAPEVILGHPPTKESDIYSIGMLMIELSNGLPLFSDRKHDSQLALEIVKGSRPQISQSLPHVYIRLALDCCNTNPSSRPNAKELLYVFSDWWKCINNAGDKLYQVQKAFMDADEVLPMLELVKMNTRVKNSDAFYTSRLLNFEDVLKRESYFSINSDEEVI